VERASQARYISSKPLSVIESTIDSGDFFRVSKKYLVNIRSVVKFKPVKGGKLELVINPCPEEPIVISQLKARSFKNWILQN